MAVVHICPGVEAPIPRVGSEDTTLGGAGNVVNFGLFTISPLKYVLVRS
jgi:hypothetical protein